MKIIEDKNIIPNVNYVPFDIDEIKGRIDSGYYKFEPRFDGNGNLITIDLVKTEETK